MDKQTKSEYNHVYYQKNKGYFVQWNLDNKDNLKDSHRESDRKWRAKRRKEDLSFKIRENLRNRVKNALKNGQKGGSAVKDLGCSIIEYKEYLECLFQPGMTWDNYGHGEGKWTIDHIKPLSSFDLTDRTEFLLASRYTNTQPMWFLENIAKGNK